MDADLLPNGNFLICDAAASRILELKPSGEKVWQYDKELKQPRDALRLPNDITVISDFDNHRLLYIRPDGAVAREIRGFNHPGKLTYQPETDSILVADKDNQRLVEITTNGAFNVIRDKLNFYSIRFLYSRSKNVFLRLCKTGFSLLLPNRRRQLLLNCKRLHLYLFLTLSGLPLPMPIFG